MKPAERVARVDEYIEVVSHHDVEGLGTLFAADAVVEDPVGSTPHRGIDAICEFYRKGFEIDYRLERTGPVRCAGDAVAFPFRVVTGTGGSGMRIDVIDVFEFDGAGRIVRMRAYWGPENCTAGPEGEPG
jgi:steroid delta-isomerase